MREVTWKDEAGRIWVTLIPDNAPEADAPRGVPLGPPPLTELGLPLEVEVALHNMLVRHRVLTWEDAQTKLSKITAAVNASLRLSAQKVQAVYYRERFGEL